MKRFVALFIPLFLVGCSSMTSSAKGEREKAELTINKVRTDIEDIKHDLNTYEIEHHILEGKLADQEHSLTILQKETIEAYSTKLDAVLNELTGVRSEIEGMKNKQKQLLGDISELTSHANDTTNALAQYKGKIESLEKVLEEQDGRFEQIAGLKKTLNEIAEYHKSNQYSHYTVKTGDSLEKIAKKFHTSVDEIKRINNRTNDLIIVGEEIQVPVGNE